MGENILVDANRVLRLSPTADKNQQAHKSEKNFSSFLDEALSSVNDLQIQGDEQLRLLATGDVEDVNQVVVAVEKADMALKLLSEVRNKLLEAYQQLSRLQ